MSDDSPGRQVVASSAASETPVEAASAVIPVVTAEADHTQQLHYSGDQLPSLCHLYTHTRSHILIIKDL